MSDQPRILVVGEGLSGAVYARTLAEGGYQMTVIDRWAHLGGNAYDEVVSGVRVHRYGPHLFHTNNRAVLDWLERFGAFVPYEHRVQALLADGRHVPLPVNRETIQAVFDVKLASAEEVQALLHQQAVPIAQPHNAAEYLNAHVGTTLTDLFCHPYTWKLWALDLRDMNASVVKRIPLRIHDENRYFPNDKY